MLNRRPVEVWLESSRALTVVTSLCLAPTENPSAKTVRIPLAEGGFEILPLARLKSLTLEGVLLPESPVGVRKSREPCRVTLGMDVLEEYGLAVDPAVGTVSFLHSQAASSGEALELSRDPTTDLAMLPIRIHSSGGDTVAPFVISTTEAQTSVSPDFLRRFQPLALELGPEIRVPPGRWKAAPNWGNKAAVGLLGTEVLGNFAFTLDFKAQRLTLRKPPEPP